MRGDESVRVELSHKELSLLLYALEGGADRPLESVSCEEACPVTEEFDRLLGGGLVPPEKRLVHHLNTHLREGLIESGIFELIAEGKTRDLTAADQMKLKEANERLKDWRCEMKLESGDLRLLGDALGRLPRSAWIAMPRTLLRLRKKLKDRK
ncbi:MAG TPA: hypothetical protein VNO14_09830 [Blastocatellia bacterium]|nr:hypothetical protein [Blastocatellia bacterium]